MKNVMKMLLVLLVSMIGFNPSNIYASESTNEEKGYITTNSGTEVVYDNSAINGGIDTTNMVDIPKFEIEPYYDPNATFANSVNVVHQTQVNSYYCGPAAGSMIVRQLGYNYDQYEMASYFGTTTDGTGFGTHLATTLTNLTGIQFGCKWHVYTDVATIKDHIQRAIDYGNAVLLNTYEEAGQWFLAGHSNLGTDVYHYGVISGYTSYGDLVTYVDPGAGYFGGFVTYRNYQIQTISNATGGRGYIW